MISNITPRIQEKIGRNLHNQPNHPIEIIKKRIYKILDQITTDSLHGESGPFCEEQNFVKFDQLNPYVSTEDNFDLLLIPPEHPARSRSDTYYLDEKTVLRTHTSAHQNQLLRQGHKRFLVTGDVYRKDEIDRSHYPVFHQMEGLCVVKDDTDPEVELKRVLVDLVQALFPKCEYRINSDYFPFTDPSFEIEILFNDRWLEVLGCGVTQPKILENCGLKDRKAWAFGLGLERLAMVLFSIPDIRYFWSTDPKFLDQFASGEIVPFKPYSTLDPIDQVVSFWIQESGVAISEPTKEIWTEINDFFNLCREEAGDLISEIVCIDTFYHPKKKQLSKAFRITYSPPDTKMNDPGAFKSVVLEIQANLRSRIVNDLSVTLR